jgi:hypothetical protein
VCVVVGSIRLVGLHSFHEVGELYLKVVIEVELNYFCYRLISFEKNVSINTLRLIDAREAR